jgi:ABC-type phosphate transport system substrate-binding protein
MNKTIFIVAVLAAATVLAAGLTMLPGSVQEAQANPCSNNLEEAEAEGDVTGGGGSTVEPQEEQNCDLTGYFEFDE